MNDSTYKKSECCQCDCDWIDTEDPCWGEVDLLDEEDLGDDYRWIHACEGHADALTTGKYIPRG